MGKRDFSIKSLYFITILLLCLSPNILRGQQTHELVTIQEGVNQVQATNTMQMQNQTSDTRIIPVKSNIYKWIDASGKVYYSQEAPKGLANVQTLDVPPPSPPSEENSTFLAGRFNAIADQMARDRGELGLADQEQAAHSLEQENQWLREELQQLQQEPQRLREEQALPWPSYPPPLPSRPLLPSPLATTPIPRPKPSPTPPVPKPVPKPAPKSEPKIIW